MDLNLNAHKMPRATLHYGGRSPVDGAWDAENRYCVWLKLETRSR